MVCTQHYWKTQLTLLICDWRAEQILQTDAGLKHTVLKCEFVAAHLRLFCVVL